MGGVLCSQRDVWAVIYEKGIADARRVQRHALKLTIEGKLSGTSASAQLPPIGAPPPAPAPPLQPHGSNSSSSNNSYTGGGGGGGGGVVPWGSSAVPSTTSAEKLTAITAYVENEWSERDRKELRRHATRLWEQYHENRSGPYLQSAELLELTRDSLLTLQRHISVFINDSYEVMKKHTQLCMINLLARFRLASVSAGTSMAPASALRETGMSTSNNSASSLGSPTINVTDIEWLNEQVEAEKKALMQTLNAQIEEWIEHAVDVAEAIMNKMVSREAGEKERRMERSSCVACCCPALRPASPSFCLLPAHPLSGPATRMQGVEEALHRHVRRRDLRGRRSALLQPPSADACRRGRGRRRRRPHHLARHRAKTNSRAHIRAPTRTDYAHSLSLLHHRRARFGARPGSNTTAAASRRRARSATPRPHHSTGTDFTLPSISPLFRSLFRDHTIDGRFDTLQPSTWHTAASSLLSSVAVALARAGARWRSSKRFAFLGETTQARVRQHVLKSNILPVYSLAERSF